jgi:hypothetical protein
MINRGGQIGLRAAKSHRWKHCGLASESGRTITRKLTRYLEHFRSGREQRDHGTYPRVLWAVPDSRRAKQLTAVLTRQPAAAQQLFTVCLQDEVVGRLAAEARQ